MATSVLLLSLLFLAVSTAVHGDGFSVQLTRRHLASGKAQSQIFPDNSQFLMKVSVGTPPVDVYAITDTGSDLFWTQCMPCKSCYKQTNPVVDPSKSSSFKELSCKSTECQFKGSGAVCRGEGACNYSYGYGGGLSEGNLATETMAVVSKSGKKVEFKKVMFGCGHNNSGAFNVNEMGLIGFGRAPASFISQIGPSVGGRKFSMCLMPFNTDPKISSTINFGSGSEVTGPGVITAKLVPTPDPTYYTFTLSGITVGKTFLPFNKAGPPKTGNVILDSGVPPTLLPEEFHARLVAEVKRQIPLKPLPKTNCYVAKGNFEAPPMILHLNDGVNLPLSTVQTFTRQKDGSYCFVANSIPGDGGIIGNFMMANYLVGYDIDAMTVSFKPTDCTKVG